MFELWEHQKKGIARAIRCRDFGLFFEPGTGKTRTTIEILRYHYNVNKMIVPTLIFCPPVVIPNWKREFLKFSKIPQDNIVMLTGPGVKREKIIQALSQDTIVITNYETLQMKGTFEALKTWHPCVVVYDESHKLKNPSAVRTKKAIELSDTAAHRYLLTGTPVLNSYMDIFSQFRAMDCGESFGKNFFGFRAQFFWDMNGGMPKQSYFPNWVPRGDTEVVMQKLIAAKSMYVEKSQCLDLPPLVRQEIDVELGAEQARLYEDMKKHFIAYINDKACVASLALTKALRMQQILSGYVKLDGQDEVQMLKDVPRLNALTALLEDLAPRNKVIVWAVFSPNYTQIASACRGAGVDYAFLTGDVKDKEAEIKKFKENDAVRVLIAHPGAGGIGVNLTESSHSIIYSRSFSLEHDLQSRARNYRGGSEIHEKITQIDLVARGTIDEIILEALSKKQDLATNILELKSKLS